ncbi:SH3 domain-containing protein [Hymenobacter sediminis]|uniref:SH3 domain-containing protein n=1 Tax=Hymenobacter sediminis TaxID=2218621 RepID=UPI000DA65483|nr:SH3 domain-containing protein [Hymenobacter sediminis]RPD49607.1 SH3 domain-containing protein [Hymenobacter sediminis]
MKKTLLCLGASALLASCSATSADSRSNRASSGPVAHNTVVECVLYDGMTKTSQQLTTITSGNEVQVMDTVDAYFVKVRVTADGKTQNGYMYRTCFAQK